MAVATAISGWDRAMDAADKVRERAKRAAAVLDGAGVPYAMVGGHAIAEYVGRVDEEAVRTTRDVDILIRRREYAAARVGLAAGGFVNHPPIILELFRDSPAARPSEAVRLVYAGERVRPGDLLPTPDVIDSERSPQFQVISLRYLVQMKLVANRWKDRMHLVDLIQVGLVDRSWPARFPAELAARLQELLDDPNDWPVLAWDRPA